MPGLVKYMPNLVKKWTVASLIDETLACKRSLIAKTESLGSSSAPLQSLICAAPAVDVLYGVPSLQAIHPELIAALSTIAKIFAPNADPRTGA